MFEKSFITDCEGPLTLNDNAFELCARNYVILICSDVSHEVLEDCW